MGTLPLPWQDNFSIKEFPQIQPKPPAHPEPVPCRSATCSLGAQPDPHLVSPSCPPGVPTSLSPTKPRPGPSPGPHVPLRARPRPGGLALTVRPRLPSRPGPGGFSPHGQARGSRLRPSPASPGISQHPSRPVTSPPPPGPPRYLGSVTAAGSAVRGAPLPPPARSYWPVSSTCCAARADGSCSPRRH